MHSRVEVEKDCPIWTHMNMQASYLIEEAVTTEICHIAGGKPNAPFMLSSFQVLGGAARVVTSTSIINAFSGLSTYRRGYNGETFH